MGTRTRIADRDGADAGYGGAQDMYEENGGQRSAASRLLSWLRDRIPFGKRSRRGRARAITFDVADDVRLSEDELPVTAILAQIQSGKRQSGRLHLIVESDRAGEWYVIYPVNELLLPFYDDAAFRVVGIGKGRRRTQMLVTELVTRRLGVAAAPEVG